MGSPIAYFLTWRTYGSWLPGDERGWINNDETLVGRPVGTPDSVLHDRAAEVMRDRSYVLTPAGRAVVGAAISGVCEHKKWRLLGCSVRTNHVHVVVGCRETPEKALGAFKAWGTRRLREAGLAGAEQDVWGRHGSTIWLWTAEEVQSKVDYVTRLQDGAEPAVLKRRAT